MTAKYVLGIDLGTTNCVLAHASLEEEEPQIELAMLPQLVAAGTVESLNSLPSFLYLAEGSATAAGALDVPWAAKRTFAVGEMARRQAAEIPDRTVGAAKSWLCHSRVDRRQDILPWGAPADVPQVSPVEASRRYLEHVVAAWNAAKPEAPLVEQCVVLTVPASFDASARELTREAAEAAGLPAEMILLEEPQAAVYSWLAAMGERWRQSLAVGDSIFVCDVGGGTTDLTLVAVVEEDGELVLRRKAVGDHLLVGGDNMDLALAHFAAQRFAEQGTTLDPWQSVSLWHACRTAKETLLTAGGPERHTISVLGRGSKLIGGTVSIEVSRDEVSNLLTEGFFPPCAATDRPARMRASGFQEIGLPFESDTAITRHLAAFLATHGPDADTPARPTHLLFNGGVFKVEQLREKLMATLADWFGADAAPQVLPGGADELDHAAARGATQYGWTKQRGGVRIRGGTARSYYVGIETAGLAIPGAPRPLRALCVAPIGMEEGTETAVPSGEIGLVVGEPAHFRLFSSSIRKDDRPGDVLSAWSEEEVAETDSLETTLATDESIDEPYVPVQFHSKITELGTFELWCVSTRGDKRWKLEFSVRQDAEE